MKCCNNVNMRLNGLLATHTIRSQLSSEKAAPQFTFSKNRSYYSHRISLILLHRIGKLSITLSISTSVRSTAAYRICIPLLTAIVLHPHKTLLCLLPDLWLSLDVRCVPYINYAFSLETDLATRLRGWRTRARTDKCDMTAEHAFSWLCDVLMHSIDKSGRLADAKQIAS
jgi:hypothetical protein